MSWELYYTSAERGLKPHSRGFCTVARTDGIPSVVFERLESLSGYQPVFPGGSIRAEENPVSWSHWRIPVASRTRSVLSRVAYVGSDYSGRPSSFAHHVLLEPSEQQAAGPVAMLRSRDLMESSWVGEPMVLPPRVLPDEAAPLAIASGSPWPERLAAAFRQDPEKPVYIVYRPTDDVLPMLDESISLLPPPMRWQVTFTTHFNELPAGLTCAWRCVVADTPAAAAATRAAKGLLIDLTREPEGS